jgi:hypothetical protein
MMFLSAGQDVATGDLGSDSGTDGCFWRLWWWSVVAPTTGQVYGGLVDVWEGLVWVIYLAFKGKVDVGVIGRESAIC